MSFLFNNLSIDKKTEKEEKVPGYVDLSSKEMYSLTTSSVDNLKKNGEIIELNLSNNNFEDVPKEIEEFVFLLGLNISYNKIKQMTFRLDCLTLLTRLDLCHNEIEKLPKTFSSLVFLEYLDLSHNNLTRFGFDMSKLKMIKVLCANSNNITDAIEEIHHLKTLQRLELSDNKIKTIAPIIRSLKQLVHFDISYNLVDKLPHEIIYLVNLQILCVNGNPLLCPSLSICDMGLKHIIYYLSELEFKTVAVSSSKFISKNKNKHVDFFKSHENISADPIYLLDQEFHKYTKYNMDDNNEVEFMNSTKPTNLSRRIAISTHVKSRKKTIEKINFVDFKSELTELEAINLLEIFKTNLSINVSIEELTKEVDEEGVMFCMYLSEVTKTINMDNIELKKNLDDLEEIDDFVNISSSILKKYNVPMNILPSEITSSPKTNVNAIFKLVIELDRIRTKI